MYYAGIDWADQHHDAVVIDDEGRRVGSIRVEHNARGLAKLMDFLKDKATPRELAVVVETDRGLLVATLLESGLAVYPVNPKTVNRRRAPSGAKTDAIDAYMLARTGRSDLRDLRRLAPDDPVVEELKLLTRDQDMLIQSQTRLVNQLTACLKAYYPVALGLFSKLHQPSTLAFLRAFPTPEAAREADEETIARFLREAGHPRFASKSREIRAKLSEPQLSASPAVVRAKSLLMLALVEQLSSLVVRIAEYDKEIERLFSQHFDAPIFRGLPGAGKRLAPRLLAEWGGDRERYSGASGVQALAGTSPVVYQSGNYSRARKRYACSKPFRNTLYQYAWASLQKEEWAAGYYERKRKEGKSHTMALRALANQWVRIIHALWKTRQTYESSVFLQAQREHARRAA